HNRLRLQPTIRLFFVLGAFLSTLLWVANGQTAPSAVSFTRDVGPVLTQKCIACHGASQQMATLDLSSSEALVKGGQNGPAIAPGDAESSRLYRRIVGKEQPAMPLGSRLSEREIGLIRDWINAGARWEGDKLGAVKVAPAKPASWWSFRKPVRHSVPQS